MAWPIRFLVKLPCNSITWAASDRVSILMQISLKSEVGSWLDQLITCKTHCADQIREKFGRDRNFDTLDLRCGLGPTGFPRIYLWNFLPRRVRRMMAIFLQDSLKTSTVILTDSGAEQPPKRCHLTAELTDDLYSSTWISWWCCMSSEWPFG